MKTLTLKTSLMCDGCVAKVAPLLDAHAQISNWKADMQHPDHLLEITGSDFELSDIQEVLAQVGFTAEVQV